MSSDQLQVIKSLREEYDAMKNVHIGITDLTARSPSNVKVDKWKEVAIKTAPSMSFRNAPEAMAKAHNDKFGPHLTEWTSTAAKGLHQIYKKSADYSDARAKKDFGEISTSISAHEGLEMSFSPAYSRHKSARETTFGSGKKKGNGEGEYDGSFGTPVSRGYCETAEDLPKALTAEYPPFFLGHPASCLWSCSVDEIKAQSRPSNHSN